jgi:predicted alpha/beta-fold hydrolase
MKHTTREKTWWSSVGMGVLAILLLGASLDANGQPTNDNRKTATREAAAVKYSSIKIDGLDIAYREARNRNNPKIVLLHGFPAASHQYRDLIRSLSDTFHVIAPDYPGFGLSDMSDPATYDYTFDGIAEVEDHLDYIANNMHRFYAEKVANGKTNCGTSDPSRGGAWGSEPAQIQLDGKRKGRVSPCTR